MSDDLLGFERFGQHAAWRCRGRVDGDDNEDGDLDPRTFVFGRHLDQWLLTSDGRLLTVGDSQRDLVAVTGGLVRHPPGLGFAGFLGAELLRQTAMFSRQAVGEASVVESMPSQRAGRDAVDLHLDLAGVAMVLGVDAETGVWTYFSSSNLTITVDQLEVEPEGLSPLYALLDLVPDLDLSPRVQVSPALEGVLQAVQEASGLQVGVLDQDGEVGTFRFVLLDSASRRPVGLVSRERTEQVLPQNLFGGLWTCESADDWTYLVNTEGQSTESDHRWAENVKSAIRL